MIAAAASTEADLVCVFLSFGYDFTHQLLAMIVVSTCLNAVKYKDTFDFFLERFPFHKRRRATTEFSWYLYFKTTPAENNTC
jgi:hypothetical protein